MICDTYCYFKFVDCGAVTTHIPPDMRKYALLGVGRLLCKQVLKPVLIAEGNGIKSINTVGHYLNRLHHWLPIVALKLCILRDIH